MSYKDAQKDTNWVGTKQTYELENRIIKTVEKEKNVFKALELLLTLTDEHIRSSNRKTACRKGCAYCCKSGMRIDISELESRFIKQKLKIEDTKSYIEEDGYIPQGSCPFLEDDTCSIYAYRPYQCRRHISFDVDNTNCTHMNDEGVIVMQQRADEFDQAYELLITRYCESNERKLLRKIVIERQRNEIDEIENELYARRFESLSKTFCDIRVFFGD